MSRGIELVAIRMSQTCEMPSTLVHWGVSTVMAWTTSTKPRTVLIVIDAAAKFVERPDPHRLADASNRRAGAKHPLSNGELLIELPILFLTDLAHQTIGKIGPPQIVVQEDNQLQRVAIGGGTLLYHVRSAGRFGQSGNLAFLAAQYAAVLQDNFNRKGRLGRAIPGRRSQQYAQPGSKMRADDVWHEALLLRCRGSKPSVHCDSLWRQVKQPLDSDSAVQQN